MKLTLICLLLVFGAALAAIGTLPGDPETQPEPTGAPSATTADNGIRMIAGELQYKNNVWYCKTDSQPVMLILPEPKLRESKGCYLANGDMVILYGRNVQTRFQVTIIQKNGVRYTFSE